MRTLSKSTLAMLLGTAVTLTSTSAADPLPATTSTGVAASGLAPPAELRWGRKKLNLKRLPKELEGTTRAAVERWGAWADELDYHLLLDEGERLMVLGYKKGSWLKKKAELAYEAIDRFDALLGGAAYADEGEASGDDGGAPQEAELTVVDDPADDAAFFAELPFGGSPTDAAATEASAEIDDDEFVPDSHSAVLLVCEEQEAYDAALEDIARHDPKLKDWVADNRYNAGFVLLRPPMGALLLKSELQEEYNPDNEMVNRVARLMLARRFGPWVPNWIVQGLAWRVEIDVQGTVYCFPYRTDFVGVEEHSDWGVALANLFRTKERKDRPLSVEDFAHWRRGSYNDRNAKISWGVVSWLCKEDGGAFVRFLDEMLAYAHEYNRQDAGGGGRWKRIEGWEVPIDVQKATLERLFGADLWERATEDFKKRKIK